VKEQIKEALEKITPGKWTEYMMTNLDNLEENYRAIEAGRGYFDDEPKKGFGIRGYISPNDSYLIANAPEWLRWQNERIEELEKLFDGIAQYIELIPIRSATLQRILEIARQTLGKEE
jgi:hypothetical protein